MTGKHIKLMFLAHLASNFVAKTNVNISLYVQLVFLLLHIFILQTYNNTCISTYLHTSVGDHEIYPIFQITA